jgi:poly(A) polymerase
VHGSDALALGVPEGPALGDLLDQVEDWWAERDFRPTRRECLRHLKALASTG